MIILLKNLLLGQAQAAGILGTLATDKNMADLSDLGILIINILNIMFYIAGGVAAAMICWGAFLLFTAGGDQNKAAKAKQAITAALIGAVLIMTASLLVKLYVQVLGGNV